MISTPSMTGDLPPTLTDLRARGQQGAPIATLLRCLGAAGAQG